MSNKILRRPAVEAKVGLCRSSIYHRIAQGTFPKQINLGGRSCGWLESEIEEWLTQQIEASRKNNKQEVRKS